MPGSRTHVAGSRGWSGGLEGGPVLRERDAGQRRRRRHALELVTKGEPLVMFPEATIYYYRPDEVHPLKRGAAWIGLTAKDRCPSIPVRIVPVRLNYADRFLRFRSRIEVVVQEPIAVVSLPVVPAQARYFYAHVRPPKIPGRLGQYVVGGTLPRPRTPRRPGSSGVDRRTGKRPGVVPHPRPEDTVLDPRTAPTEADVEPRLGVLSGTLARSGGPGAVHDVVAGAGDLLRGDRRGDPRTGDTDARGHSRHALPPTRHSTAGSASCWRPALFSFTAYKVAHLTHHRNTRTSRDPDDFLNVSSSRLLRSLVFYGWLAAGMLAYLLHVPRGGWRLAGRRDRRAILSEYATIGVTAVSALMVFGWLGRLEVPLHAWLLPLPVAVAFGNVRSWAEHALTRPGHPLTHTRTVKSNRVVSFLMCNLNYHLEHHLFPGVPWYNLPLLHTLLSDEYRRAGAFVHRSYLRFLWEAGRAGVHGTVTGL